MMQARQENNQKSSEEIVLHFINGNLRLDGWTNIPSNIQTYMVSIYAEEYIGKTVGSNVIIGYTEEKQVWVKVEDADNNDFSWGNWETDRQVAILFYMLTEDREYLLYGSNEHFFCYLTIPKRDPRQNHVKRIPNTHLTTTYLVLCGLLKKTNQYEFKIMPRWIEG